MNWNRLRGFISLRADELASAIITNVVDGDLFLAVLDHLIHGR